MTHKKALKRLVVLAILSIIIFQNHTYSKAQQNFCEPGERCTFYFHATYFPCRYNEKRFFTEHGDSWVFEPNSNKWLNDQLGDFGQKAGYKWTGKDNLGIWGGCVCDAATWLNYVAIINGLKTYSTKPFHPNYDIDGVPNTGDTLNKDYFVSINDNDGPNPKDTNGNTLAGGTGDVLFENKSNETVTLKWQVSEFSVDIWVEKAKLSSDVSPNILSKTQKTNEQIVSTKSETPVKKKPSLTNGQVIAKKLLPIIKEINDNILQIYVIVFSFILLFTLAFLYSKVFRIFVGSTFIISLLMLLYYLRP